MFSDRRIRTSLIAIVADLILTAIKLVTSWITGSTALLADAYHSLSDILVSLTLLCGICIRVSVEKGRLSISEEKAHQLESILAIIMSCLILYVPVEIIQEIKSQEAEDLQHLWVGIVGILLCIAIAW
ncbi:cation transporter, partial [Oleiphilus sp. HI0043]|uniref:cation transporter n=5 Tax=Oleiphilus TaxID=141450 RepID=UPI000AAB72D5